MNRTDPPRRRERDSSATPTPGPRPAAESLSAPAQSKAERALGWDDADLDSPEFRELGAPESSSLLSADIDAAIVDVAETPAQPKLPPVEWALVSTVNALWAVIGPVLWLPVLVREVLVAVLEMAHGALTGQQSPKARRRLREASRFVSGRFLERSGRDPQKSLRRRIRPFRLLFELVWTTAAYAGLLHAVGWIELPLAAAREKMTDLWSDQLAPLPGRLTTWLGDLPERAPSALREILALEMLALGVLAGCALLLLLLGVWLGSRRR